MPPISPGLLESAGGHVSNLACFCTLVKASVCILTDTHTHANANLCLYLFLLPPFGTGAVEIKLGFSF